MIDIDTEHPEFDAWRWFPLEGVEAQIVPFKRALYHEIVEAFRLIRLKRTLPHE